jgi:uncharacterized protein (DUF1800 family)
MPITSSLGLAAFTGILSPNQKKYLLNRSLFGARFSDLVTVESMSLSQILDMLFTPTPLIDAPLNHYQPIKNDADIPLGSPWVLASFNQELDNLRFKSLCAWLTKRILRQGISIQEKLTLFLHNLIPVQATVVNDSRKLYQYYELLYSNSFSSYKAIVLNISKNPGMLDYLNGKLNNVNRPDENYARELLELFTLGKGPDSKYTEEDVRQAAKVLTGYQITADGLNYTFNPTRHDTSNKNFSTFFNNQSIVGKSGTIGENELSELIDMLFDQKETAKHFCRKLYKFFVYYEIDSTVETQIITPLADYFIAQNFNIGATLRKLLESQHFWDIENYGAMIKSPMDFILGYLRMNEMAFPDDINLNQSYEVHYEMATHIGLLGQVYFEPPAVAGWDAYHQYPLYHEAWINTTSANNRAKLSTLYLVGYRKFGWNIQIDVIALSKKFSNPANPNALAEEAVNYFHTLPITSNLKDKLVSILRFNQAQDYYWTNAWNEHISNPNDAAKKKIVTDLLTLFYKYIFDLAEFQLI